MKPTYEQLIELLNEIVELDQHAQDETELADKLAPLTDKGAKYLEAYTIAKNRKLQRRYIAEDQVKSLASQVGALRKTLEKIIKDGDGCYSKELAQEALDTAASGEGK